MKKILVTLFLALGTSAIQAQIPLPGGGSGSGGSSGSSGSSVPPWIVTASAPPTIASGTWTQVNATGTATFADIQGGILISQSNTSSGVNNVNITAPGAGTGFTVTAKIISNCYRANYRTFGILVSDGTKYETFNILSISDLLAQAQTPMINIGAWTNSTTTTTDRLSAAVQQVLSYPFDPYLRITYNGTTLSFQISPTGTTGTFYTIYSEAGNAFLSAPSQVGFFSNAGGGTTTTGCAAMLVHWSAS